MDRRASAGLLLVIVAVPFAADPAPAPLPAEALRRFVMAQGNDLPRARWPQLRFTPDGKTLERIGGNTAVTWETATGKEVVRLSPEKILAGVPGVPLIADTYPKKLVAQSPNGKAVVTYSNPTVQQMQFTLTLTVDGKEWRDTGLAKRMVGVLQLAFTPDGRYALAQLDQEHLHIWDVTADESAGEVITFSTPGPSGYRYAPLMHTAPDSKRVALVEADPKMPTTHKDALPLQQWRLGVYELETRRRTGGIAGNGILTAVDWSADASRIGGAGLAAGTEYGREAGFAFVAASSDGRFLMEPVALPKPATACAVSPDGRALAVGTGGEVHLFEVRTGKLRHAFKPETGAVLALHFHPDGGSLVSESTGGSVFLWDVRGRSDANPAPDATELDVVWANLDSTDAEKGFRAIRRVAARPAEALPFLKRKVGGQKRPTIAEIDERVALLKSRAFAERDTAEKELRAMGRIAHPALKAAVATDSSPELQARAGRLLAAGGAPASVRTVRMVEAVERVGNADAKALLTSWADDAGPELAAEAAEALARWRK